MEWTVVLAGPAKKALKRVQRLNSVGENSAVPPGLESFFPLFPTLPRWAKLVRPSGTGFSGIAFHSIA